MEELIVNTHVVEPLQPLVELFAGHGQVVAVFARQSQS